MACGKWYLSEVEPVPGRNYVTADFPVKKIRTQSPSCLRVSDCQDNQGPSTSGSCRDAVMFVLPQLPVDITVWLRLEDSETMVQKKLCFLVSGVFQRWYYSNGKLMSTVWRMGRVVSVVAHSCNSSTQDAKAGELLWVLTGLGEVVNSRIAWVTNWEHVSTCLHFRNPHFKK